MNKLPGTIENVFSDGAIMLVDIKVCGQVFSALMIDGANTLSWAAKGQKIDIAFKETELSLAKNLEGKISIRNRMSCIIESIDKGKVLSVVKLIFNGYSLHSVITSRAVEALNIAPGDMVMALVKSNEVMLINK